MMAMTVEEVMFHWWMWAWHRGAEEYYRELVDHAGDYLDPAIDD